MANRIGQKNEWDRRNDYEVPLLDWGEIRTLQEEGIKFGSHSVSHPYLTELSVEEVVREAARSKVVLEQSLATQVQTFAYPYGASDAVTHHLIGACGYTIGLSCRPGPSQFYDSPLALPRVEISGYDGLREFVAKVEDSFEDKITD